MTFNELKKRVQMTLKTTESVFETECSYQNLIDAEINRRQQPIFEQMAKLKKKNMKLSALLQQESADEQFYGNVDKLTEIIEEECELHDKLGEVEYQVYKDLGLR